MEKEKKDIIERYKEKTLPEIAEDIMEHPEMIIEVKRAIKKPEKETYRIYLAAEIAELHEYKKKLEKAKKERHMPGVSQYSYKIDFKLALPLGQEFYKHSKWLSDKEIVYIVRKIAEIIG